MLPTSQQLHSQSSFPWLHFGPLPKKCGQGIIRATLGDDWLSFFPLFSAISRARAIKYRQENQEAVGGFFSQIGELYVVHHLWGRLEALKPLFVPS